LNHPKKERRITMFIPKTKKDAFLKELIKLNKKLAKYDSSIEIISVVPAKEYVDFIDGCVYSSLERVETNIMGSKYAVISGFEYQLSEPAVKGKQDVEYLGMVEFIDGIPQIFASKDNLIDCIDIKQTDVCDHCQVLRKRNKYFYFREGNEIKNIGSTCVHEWFGFDIDAIFSEYQNFMNFITEFDPEKAGFQQAMQDCNYTPLNLVIKSVAEVTNGFTEYWEKEATARHALAFSQSDAKGKHSIDAEAIKKDVEQMWNITPTNDFEFNIVSALFTDGQLHDNVANKHFGVVCWAIWKTMFAKLEANKAEGNSEYIGTVGERRVIRGTMKLLSTFDTFYGFTYLYQIETKDGIAKWFASKDFAPTLAESVTESYADISEALKNEGVQVALKSTIKEHKEYNGNKETIINRCKLV
jgi:hypothetical protein